MNGKSKAARPSVGLGKPRAPVLLKIRVFLCAGCFAFLQPAIFFDENLLSGIAGFTGAASILFRFLPRAEGYHRGRGDALGVRAG